MLTKPFLASRNTGLDSRRGDSGRLEKTRSRTIHQSIEASHLRQLVNLFTRRMLMCQFIRLPGRQYLMSIDLYLLFGLLT